jgi:predicted AlkP superfamily pyrophosphatase or phosphodiesterase
MLNTASVQAVDASTFSQHFVKPCYDSYCFSNYPATIQYLLTGEGQSALPLDVFGELPTRYDKVVFMFIDAFGWRFFERYAEKYDFLKIVLEQGVVSKLTSQFPSTTAAHVTCIHTGQNVGQSGVYEWSYYEPLVDALMLPLLFAYANDYMHDGIKRSAISAQEFYPRRTVYETLHAQGIISHALQYKEYATSTYSNVTFRGAHVHSYASIQEALVYLSELLMVKMPSPTYYFLYFDRIDAICHTHGPNSKQFDGAVHTFLQYMQELFYKPSVGKTGKTLLMMSADHGQIEVYPQTTYYLDKHIPSIEQYLKRNQKGQLLVPAGSARDMFLYVHDEAIDEVVGILQQHLIGRAEVYKTQDLLEQHFFGTQAPSSVFLHRLGNVVILPYKNESVWWSGAGGKPTMNFLGHHGGLTREEVELPLLLLPL